MSYFTTKIKSVGAGIATDFQGKILRFIGNWDCTAGDIVWTDGNYIFGNSSKKPAILDSSPQKGIPVSFDNSRGYFNSSGKFKNYRISKADWIVNTDKIFESGDEDIIDAEIIDSGNLQTVTKGFYRFKNAPTFHNHLYTQAYHHPVDSQGETFFVCSEVTPYVGQLFDYPGKSFADIPAENTPVMLNQTEINLKPYADLAESYALEAKNIILSRSKKTDDAVNWTRQPAPPNDFIALSYAAIVAFHVSKNGDWDAIISTSAMGICFPYLTFDGSIFYRSFPNGEDKNFSENLVACINDFEDIVFKRQSLPFQPTFAQYPDFAGDVTDEDDEYTPVFKRYILNKIAYYIPLAKFKYYYWYPIIFSACKILRVHNGEVTGTLYQSHGGGNVVESPEEWDETESTSNFYEDFVFYDFADNASDSKLDFPLDENYFCNFSPYDISSVYNSDGKIFDIPHNIHVAENLNGYQAYGKYQGYYYNLTDTEAETVASKNKFKIDNLFGRQIFIPTLSYEFYGTSEESFSDNPQKDNYPYMSVWFKNPYEDADDSIISYCFAELKKGGFLFGARGGDLYKIDAEGQAELIGSGLKNFRLRELKNIDKAKK